MQPDLGPIIGSTEPQPTAWRPALDDRTRRIGPIIGYAALVLWVIGAVIWAITISSLPATGQDHHHRHHAFYQNWISRDGKGCCNDRDCGELAAENERESSGFLEVRIEGQWCPVLSKHYLQKGNVPNAAASHICVEPRTQMNTRGPCERFLCYQPQPRS